MQYIMLLHGVTRNKINIFVKDTGPGIPKDKQNDVFEIFKQLDPAPTSPFEGTGLGLALSKELTLKILFMIPGIFRWEINIERIATIEAQFLSLLSNTRPKVIYLTRVR